MKYQFQFAGANVSRRSSQPRKRLRIVLLVVAFIMAVLAYWQYLQHLTHGSRRIVANVKPAETVETTAATAAAKTVTTVATVTTAAGTQTAATAKNVADIATAAGDTLPQTATATPVKSAAPAQPMKATPVATAAPVSVNPTASSEATPASVPVMRITSEPPPPPAKPRVRTPEDRLMRAGMTAFNNVLDLATKYPDSYGFRAQDTFKDATLGKPIPVYTIDESDRAKYQSGQPVKPLLKPSDTWVFPVCVEDHVCCMVQVQYTGRDYVPGSASKLLGSAWNKIVEKWPESKGYHPCIVVNPEIPGYFFTVPELPMPNMTDIIRLAGYHPNLSPADVILASWR